MAEPDIPPAPRLYPLESLIDAATADAALRFDARVSGKPLGALTPIPELTGALGGSLAPGVHILHGTPGSGKTAFALQTACECQCPALFVTCEMSPIELLRRIAARATGTYLGRFKSGELSPDTAREHFRDAANSARDLAILDATSAPLTPAALREFAAIVRNRYQGGHFLIVLDSVHAWANGWQAESTEYETLNVALDSIRQIAQSVEAPALCIAERNRMSMKGGGQSASAGTRRFEYGAESVIELNADDAAADAYGDKPVSVALSKNRHGALPPKIDMLFNGAIQQFRPAEKAART